MSDRANRRSNLLVVVSACLFLVFDAAVLGLGYWITHQVEADAVAINLAGRQRMLSQRMVKALLQVHLAEMTGQRADAERDELDGAVALFDATLNAFADGGTVRGGDGRPVEQRAIAEPEGVTLVQQTLQVWRPYHAALQAAMRADDVERKGELARVVTVAGKTSLELLDLANRTTSHVESASRSRTERIRLLQLTAFGMALVNFLALLYGVWRRVRGLHESHEQVLRQVRQDPLTGLANRVELQEHLDNVLVQVEPSGHHVVVGFLDLNRFKPVNDQYGHAAGDAVLREVARRLRARLRHSDLVARFGGDEFVIVLQDIAAPADVTPILDGLVQAISAPFHAAGTQLGIGVSIGAVLVQTGGVSARALLKRADQVMYRAKRDPQRQWLLAVLQDPHGDPALLEHLGRTGTGED